MKRILAIIVTVAFVLGGSMESMSQDNKAVFQSLIRKYEESINAADTVLGAKIWSKTDGASFINPRSTEYGWKGVKNIYKMFADNFTERKLHGFDEKINVYGDVAWLTFEWVFDATLKFNKQKMQTKGRETQIWRKENNDWKLVHVHYSGLPQTGQGQGF